MSARQIAALLKSNRQDGWTNNNNNRNAHQVHNNNISFHYIPNIEITPLFYTTF